MKTLSIIIPVYNAEKYLIRCIDSLLKYDEINEIVLVDDGSTDGSLGICNSYSKKNKKIKVYSQKNSGPSSARNYGITVCQSEYMMFVDSDDYVNENFNKVLDMLNEKMFDYYLFDYQIEKIGKKSFDASESFTEYMFQKSDKERIKKLIVSEKINSPCTKIYKRDIIINNNIKFNEKINLAEDLLFNLQYLEKCKNIYESNLKFYNYCYNDIESLTKKFRSKKYEVLMRANDEIRKVLSQLGLEELQYYLIYKNLFSVFCDLHKSDCPYSKKQKIEFIKEKIKKHKPKVILNCGSLMSLWTIIYSLRSAIIIYECTKIYNKIKR